MGNNFTEVGSDNSYGAIPYSWQSNILQYCVVDGPNSFICDQLLTNEGILVLGCINIITALLLGIILVRDIRKPKEGSRFLFYHNSLLFGIQILVLLGFYFIFVYAIVAISETHSYQLHHNLNTDTTNFIVKYSAILLILFISECILLIPIVSGSFLYWWQSNIRNNNVTYTGPNNTTKIEALDEFQDLGSMTLKAIAIGITQILLLLLYINTVVQNIGDQLSIDSSSDYRVIFYVSYMVSALLQALYAVGVNDVFGSIYLQTTFWLKAFSINGTISLTQHVYVSPELTQEELKDYCFDDMMKVSKNTMIGRCTMNFVVNIVGTFVITIILPLHLAMTRDPITLVLNATAAYFICQLDDIASVTLWLTYKDPKTKSNYYHNGEVFRYNVLHKNNKLGFEIREYSSYNHVEFSSFPEMEIAMAENTPLDESHTITEAKVGGKDVPFEIINIRQPIKGFHIEDDFDNSNGTTTTGNIFVRKTNKKVVAVAKISNLRYDCSLFTEQPSKSEILSHATNKLRDVLKLCHFKVSTPPTSPLLEEGEIVIFAKYNDSSSGSSSGGEVWIYLDENDEEVRKLAKTDDNEEGEEDKECHSENDCIESSSNCITSRKNSHSKDDIEIIETMNFTTSNHSTSYHRNTL